VTYRVARGKCSNRGGKVRYKQTYLGRAYKQRIGEERSKLSEKDEKGKERLRESAEGHVQRATKSFLEELKPKRHLSEAHEENPWGHGLRQGQICSTPRWVIARSPLKEQSRHWIDARESPCQEDLGGGKALISTGGGTAEEATPLVAS